MQLDISAYELITTLSLNSLELYMKILKKIKQNSERGNLSWFLSDPT